MTYQENANADQIQPISLIELWNTICRRKKMISASVALFLALGFLFYQFSPRMYEASAVVLLDNQQRNIQIKEVLTTEPNDIMQIPSEIQVLRSRDLVGKVIDKLGLMQNPSLLTDEPVTANTNSAAAKQADPAARDRMINRILSNLTVRQVEHSRAIEVAFEGRNPQIAADFVNTLTKLYIEQQLGSNFDQIKMTNQWLSDRVRETQKKVTEAETKAAEYRAKAGIVDSRGSDLIEQNVSDLSTKLTAAKAAAAETSARMAGIDNPKGMESSPEVLAAPLIQNLRTREAEARDNLALLQNQLGEQHPKVKEARAQVNEISGKIKQEISKLAEGLRRENDAANANVKNLEEQIELLKQDYNKYKSSNIELSALESEAQTNRSFLETLNLRFKETQSQEDSKFQAPYARIISPAAVPDRPSSPRGKLIMAASLLIGLGLGAGLALALDMLQHGVYNGKQIQQVTGRTNLAVIPKAALDSDKQLVTYADFPVAAPYSAYMQGVRELTTSLRLEMSRDPSAKIFNFTSAAAGEGKSAVVVSAARQLAIEGLKVLAIDCDARQPTLSNTFGLMKKPGLNELLQGRAKIEDILYQDKTTGAMMIGAGQLEDVNVMSRGLDEWKSLFDRISSQFDIILLDSPPIVNFAETRPLAKLSRNILCVRWEKTSLKLLAFAIDILERLEGRILGTVITMSESKQDFVQDSYRA